MLGNFQQSNLRIEIEAKEEAIKDSLLQGDRLKQWMWPQNFSSLPDVLTIGANFTTAIPPILTSWTVSILPLNLGQTFSLFRLRQYLMANNN